ncbi:NADH-ubiquinone oxidoreductase chain J [Deinococcus marmoris]|uniref:NADH-quinone oxidoreductase subunit J n=2 Tax=Deinococcus marmoris TaxID=249408 RepID=A0A1U7P0H1_9DEIO|nr:NADH-ubiquinone oxidoreductase chain J [Deinococcus marmoris]OLV18664.1 NADH-ubiquinone oxidoreductase chain J [Deinococcus marmoris]
MQWLAFGLFALLAVLGALGMTTTMSMFRSGIFLMASFIGVAGLFILLSADLIGLLQIMMYIGGMLVMILFMLLFSMDPGGAMMAGMQMSPVERLFSRGLKPQGENDGNGHQGHDMAGMGHGDASSSADDGHGQADAPSDGMAGMDHGSMKMDMGDGNRAHPAHHHAAMNHAGADEAQMTHGDSGPEQSTWGADHSRMTHGEMDAGQTQAHHAMPHGEEPGPVSPESGSGQAQMDHSSMDHGKMDMGGMSGMDHGDMQMDGDMGGMNGDMDMGGMDMSMVTPARPWAAWLGLAVTAVLVGLLLWRPAWPISNVAFSTDSPQQIGMLLMGKYMIAFEGAGLLILLGIFGAVFLQRPGSHPSDPGREAYVTADKNPVPISKDEP